MNKIVHYRDDAKDMTFEEFTNTHKSLFDESEMKIRYKEATGKEPNDKPEEKPKGKKKTKEEVE